MGSKNQSLPSGKEKILLRNSRIPPRCKRDFRSCGVLRNADLYLFTDVSGRPVNLVSLLDPSK